MFSKEVGVSVAWIWVCGWVEWNVEHIFLDGVIGTICMDQRSA